MRFLGDEGIERIKRGSPGDIRRSNVKDTQATHPHTAAWSSGERRILSSEGGRSAHYGSLDPRATRSLKSTPYIGSPTAVNEKIKIRWPRYMGVNVREVLDAYKAGRMSAEDAEKALRMDYVESIEDHTVFDHARSIRKNMPEVVYASSKSPETVAEIAERSSGRAMLISRASEKHHEAVKIRAKNAVYVKRAEMIVIGEPPKNRDGKIGIITAGTSDIKAAEEARIMAEFMGCECITRFDVGVAGLHRILEPMKVMLEEDVDCIVVAAGMEGALPSVVASLTAVPVIGVPTSTGYGMGGKGEAALMSMLQTCSPGLTVVNIDNGIGAGAAAALIARRKSETH